MIRSFKLAFGILALLGAAGIASAGTESPTQVPTVVSTPVPHPAPLGLVKGQQAPWSGVLYHEEDVKILLKAANNSVPATGPSWTWKHTLLIGVVTLAAGISGYEIHDKIK